MNAPPFLKAGDRVAIAAPSRKVSPEELAAAVSLLQNYGLHVVYNEVLFNSFHQFSAPDAERAKDLQFWLDSNDVQAIWLARGGYGLLRVVDRLTMNGLMKHPKWIIGFSDAGFLHRAVLERTGIPVIHGPMAFNAGKNTHADSRLMQLLMGSINTIEWNCDPHLNIHTNQILDGGNLSILYACMGSPDALKGNSGLLFLEDLDEYLYHIDRMVRSLLRSLNENRLKAVLCGGFTDMKDHAIPFGYDARAILSNAFEQYAVPILHQFPAGHIAENFPIILGGRYVLNCSNGLAKLAWDGFA